LSQYLYNTLYSYIISVYTQVASALLRLVNNKCTGDKHICFRTLKFGLFPVFFLYFSSAYAADVVISNATGTLGALTIGGHDIGQSFTATKTGVLKSIGVVEDSAAVSGTATLNVYNGSGTGGTVLYTKTGIDFSVIDTVTDINNYTLHNISIDSTVNITSGNVYTFVLSPGVAFDMAYYTASNTYVGGDMFSADNSGFQTNIDMAFSVTQGDGDVTPPNINSVSIPDSDHKVGDTVTATIIVTSDSDDYTTGSGGISGTINGYTLGSLTKTNDTTYTATFTITDGGSNLAAGANVGVNFTLNDSSGNTTPAFNTTINQANDAIYANLPDVDLTADTNTIAEDGGVSTLTATLSGSLNNLWPTDITVNLAYTGTGTAGTDYSKSDAIVISAGNNSNTATVTGIADTLYDAASAETAIVDISSLSQGNEGSTNQQTISITDAESPPTVALNVGNASVAENGGTSTITATLSHATYENVNVNLAYTGTATGAGTDYNTPSSSITINGGTTSANANTGITAVDDGNSDGNVSVIVDIGSVSGGGATENGIQQQTITIVDDEDGVAPTINGVSITDTSHKVGDTITATITVTSDADDYTTGSGGISGTINGYTLGSLSKSNNTTYTATFTITHGGADVAAGSDVAVNFTLNDSSGNTSSAYTNAISQTNDAIYANVPNVDLTTSTNTIAEDGGVSTLTATLSGSLNNQWPTALTVNLAYTGTGTPGTDYSKSDNILISAGNSSNTTTLTGIADTLFDAASNETAIVDISSLSVGNEGSTNQQTIVITDAESAPTVMLSTGSANVAENAGTSTITTSLSHATYASVTVNLGYSGTATGGGTDYNTPSSSITINAGSTSANATTGIIAVDDGDLEGGETIIIDITSVSGGGATENATQQQSVTIADDEVAPVVTLNATPSTITESGSTTLTATLDVATYENVTVNLAYTGTATSGNDYVAISSITILTGQTTGTANLSAIDDSTVENDESIIVDVSSVSGGNSSESGTQQQIITITDDDTPVVSLSAAPTSIAENNGSSTLTASLNIATNATVVVNLSYSGSATSGSDYQTPSSSISIPTGQTSATTTISAINDETDENNETIIVDITGVSGGAASENGNQQQTISIIDDDEPETASVSLSVSPSTITENAGTSTLIVSLNNSISEGVTIALSYSGTATRGSDYVAPPGSVSILPGQRTANVILTAMKDNELEGDETIVVDISSISGSLVSEVGTQQQTVTITDSTSVITTAADNAELDEDTSIAINVLANDKVEGSEFDITTVTVNAQPQHGSTEIDSTSGAIRYTPELNFNGSDSFGYSVKDSLGNQSATTQVTVTVAAINDAPLAVDDTMSSEHWQPLTISALNNDTDVDGDQLKIIGASVDIGTVSFSDNEINYTPDVGIVGNVFINYAISDGKEEASARVQLSMQGSDDVLPQITLPEDVEVNADALLTKVDLGVAEAIDNLGNVLPVSLENGNTFFKPGTHSVFWQATDNQARSATASQMVKVHPLVSLDKDQTVTRGAKIKVGIRLNGEAPNYPLNIPFSVSGSAEFGVDHDLEAGSIKITSGSQGEISFNTLPGVGQETLIIELDSSLNRGSKFSQQITLTEDNVAPKVSLRVEQAGEDRFVINQQDGMVKINSQISHPDLDNTYTYAWSNREQLLTDNDNSDTSFSFDPSELQAGVYHLAVTVTDADDLAYSGYDQVTLRLDLSSIALGTEDSDHDGIPDNIEGLDDDDNDGIPNYLDTINECNVVPEQLGDTDNFLVEGDPGVCLRLGDTALTGNSGGTRLLEQDVNDQEVINVGGIFDFIAYGLPIEGQQYRVVLPQIQPIPANAVYRKQRSDGTWTNFAEDSHNQLWSTQGESGFCPPPGDEKWQAGLQQGYWCVQLVMTDGGPNDADDTANGTIVDPGGVAVLLDNNQLPQAKDDQVETRINTTISINVLANDNDADGDPLEITSASATLGSVTIEDNQLYYQPPQGYFGEDNLVYGISDNQGGSASATLTITVLVNEAPEAIADSVAVTAGEEITFDVLSNDTDDENDPLQVISAVADVGTVTINADGTLTYSANAEYTGTDILSYTIRDSFGAQAQGTVTVTVNAATDNNANNGNNSGNNSNNSNNNGSTVTNRSSGGTLLYMLIIALSLLGWRNLSGFAHRTLTKTKLNLD